MASTTGKIPQFGDCESADVLLKIIPSHELGLPPSVMSVHSTILRRSEFFEARLSGRWTSSDVVTCQPQELTLDKCTDPTLYIRCIEMLYERGRVKHNSFLNVQDALNILRVGAELLFHECVNACMDYLDSMPWSKQNELDIRALFASLYLKPSADLAARLCIVENVPNCKPVEIMKEVLGDLLTLVTNGAPPKARDITQRVLFDNAKPSCSLAFSKVNEITLYKELEENLEQLKIQLRKFVNFFTWNSHQVTVASSATRWILEEMFALQLADMVVKMFSEEQELAQLMVLRIYQNPFTETLFFILVRILEAIQTGLVVAPRTVRLSLVTIWLPVIAKLGNDGDNDFGKEYELQKSLENGFCIITDTLPLIDQEVIFKIWIASCLRSRKAWPDLSKVFEMWCEKLRQAQKEKELLVASESRELSDEQNELHMPQEYETKKDEKTSVS